MSPRAQVVVAREPGESERNQGVLPAGAGAYEFSAEQNEVIGSLAKWVGVVAVAMLIAGASDLYRGAWTAAGVDLVLGAALAYASFSFRSIVSTQGQDVSHLIHALRGFGVVLAIRIVGAVVTLAYTGFYLYRAAGY